MKHSAILRYSILLICLFGLRTSYAANEKSIRLTASLGEFHDAEKTVGFLSTATDAYDDSIDVPEPPLPPEGYVLLSVEPMTGAPEWFTRFRTDYRSNTINLGQELQTWSLLLESDHTGLVEISTTIGSQIDTVSEVYVFDDSSFWNLRDSTLVHLNFVAGQPHALTIAVGTPSETQIDLSPLAGDSVYSIGGHKTLNWNVDSEIGVNQTKIEVSYNNGSTFTTLMEVDSLATTFEWDIPQATTSEGILRISAIDLLGRSIAEEHTFQIIDDSNYLQGVVILAPQAGQSVTSGTAEPVFWDYVGGVENVTGAIVDYLLPGGSFLPVASISGIDTHTDWVVPTSTFAPGVSLRIQAVVSGGVSHTATADSITILADKLLNSNFELWTIHDAEMGPPDNWAVDGGEYGVDCTVKRANQHQVDGAYCAVMEALSPGSYAMYQEQRNGAPGTRWRFSCRIYDDNPLVSGVLRIQFLDAERNVLLTTNAVPSSDGIDAQALQVESVSPELAEVVRYGVVLEAEAPGSIYVDYSKFEADPVVTFESPIGGEPLYFDSTNSLTVQWNYGASQVPIDSARLEVSLQDSSNWELISRIPSGDVTSFAWFGVDEYSRDVRFRVTAWYLSGTSVQSISNPIKLGPASFTQSLSGNWHLWSPPLLPNNRSIDAVIGNNLQGSAVTYGYINAQGYGIVDSLNFGKGYWVGLSQDETIIYNGQPQFATVASPIPSGWSLIGSGFPVSCSVLDIRVVKGADTLYWVEAYQQGWVGSELFAFDPETATYVVLSDSSELPVSAGCWIAALEDSLTVVTAPPTDSGSSPVQHNGVEVNELLTEESGFVAPIFLKRDKSILNQVYIGLRQEATQGFDPELDSPAPPREPVPSVPRIVSMWEDEKAELSTGSLFRRDIQSSLTEEFPERRWQLRIQGPISPDCSLDFISVLSSLDSTHVVKVVLDGELITLGERSIIPLHEGDVDDVTLFIGKRDYLGVRNSDEVPDRFEIDQAYPNPFNSAVMVSIALPEKTELRAEIFDVLGRKLFNNHWSSVGPGRVSFSWQGATSSGIYFVRVENSIGQVSIQKIVAVK